MGAFYIVPDVKVYFGKPTRTGELISNADELAMYLLHTAHVSVVKGKAFGEAKCIRISFANNTENIEKGLKKMKDAFSALK